MQITCPSCGLTFDTQATTNTRCRGCRKVVNIGARSRPTTSAAVDDEPSGFSVQILIGGALVAGGVAALVHGIAVRGASDAAADEPTKAWLWWCGFGVVLVVAGVFVVIRQ